MNDVVPLLKHTPSAQKPEILEAITVQREPLIAGLVESALDTSGGLRHHLLVGPRGIGKTHILSLVASRVRAADPDARDVVVGWLDEDPWAVRTYAKFLAAIALRLAGALDDPELMRAADALRASGADDDGLRGEELLRRALGRRRLVLLVENLNEIFRRIGTDGQMRFRAFAEDWGQMLVLASTPQLFDGVKRHASPFYGFFAVTHLDELSLDSAADLLRRIAELRGDAKLRRFLDGEVAMQRLRAMEALAGGHPRVWLLLAGCISVAAIDELVPLFLEALDDLTPYYQDRLRELSDPQQEVVVLLAEAGGALSNRALSERSGIPERQVATILRQLTDRGYVRRARLPEDLSIGDRRMSFWELREPLMRLCLDVKQARGKPLRIIVEFLRAWYGSRLLDELNGLPPTAELANVYASEAFRTLETLSRDDLLRGTPAEILERAERGLKLQPDHLALRVTKASALLMQGRLVEGKDMLDALIAEQPPGSVRLALRVQLATAKRALDEPFEVEPLVADADDLAGQASRSPDVATQVAFAYDLAGRFDDAAEAYARAIELNPSDSRILDAYGLALGRSGRDVEALSAFARAAELTPDDPNVYDHRGTALSRLGRYEEALEAYSRAAELAPDVAELHFRRGGVLIAVGPPEEVLEAFSCAAKLDPSNARYLGGHALGLLILGRDDEALDLCTRAEALAPEATEIHGVRGIALERLGRYEDALATYARAAELNPEEPSYLYGVANVMRRLGRFPEAEQAARHAVALDGDDAVYRFALVEAVLAGGDARRALRLLDEALATWGRARDTRPGQTDVLCTIAWEAFRRDSRRRQLIGRLVSAYRRVDAVEELGRGLVATIPLLLDDEVAQTDVDRWVDDWAHAPFERDDVPVQMLEAARAWKRDRDQRHLLALPTEQREILIEMLPR